MMYSVLIGVQDPPALLEPCLYDTLGLFTIDLAMELRDLYVKDKISPCSYPGE